MTPTKSAALEAAITNLGLAKISTTSQASGFPFNVREAVIGFYNFQDAAQFAQEFGLELTYFKKKDGWALWYRSGGTAVGPMVNKAEDYGDNYSEFSSLMSEEDFFAEEVEPFLADSDFNNFSKLQAFIDNRNDLFREIDKAREHEIVLTYNGQYYDTVSKESMSWSFDTNHIAIGCVIDWAED